MLNNFQLIMLCTTSPLWALPLYAQTEVPRGTDLWSLRFATAPHEKKFQSIDILAEIAPKSKAGFSLTQAVDRLDAFKGSSSGAYTYETNEVPYRMLAMRLELELPYRTWISFSVGRWQVHAINKVTTETSSSCTPDCVVYTTGSLNQLAMLIDIEKTYAGLSLGWQTKVLSRISIGFVALNYIIKGDSSGVQVNSINGRIDPERDRIQAAAVSYARRDYLGPSQLFIQFSL